MSAPLCPGCNKPMVDGQVFNGLLRCHWDCTDATRKRLGETKAAVLEQQRIDAKLTESGLIPSDPAWKRLGGSVDGSE